VASLVKTAGGGNRTRMTSLEGCVPTITNQLNNNDLEPTRNIGMPKSMPSVHENDTESELSDTSVPSPDIIVLADLLATLPDSDRAGIIADLPQDQRLAIARLLATRIAGAGPPEGG